MPVALWWMKAALTVVVYAKLRSRRLVGAPALARDDARAWSHERLGARRHDGLFLGLGLAEGGDLGGAERGEVGVHGGALGRRHGEGAGAWERTGLGGRDGRGGAGARGARGGLLRVVARVDEFHPQPLGERCRQTGPVLRGLGPYAYLDAVRVADPERGGGTADRGGFALGAPGVGSVVGVVCLEVLPAGPATGAGRAGADLDGSVEFGVGVVPDHTDEGEAVGVVPAQTLGRVGGRRPGVGGFTGGP